MIVIPESRSSSLGLHDAAEHRRTRAGRLDRADDHLAQQELDRLEMFGAFVVVRVELRADAFDRVGDAIEALRDFEIGVGERRARKLVRGCCSALRASLPRDATTWSRRAPDDLCTTRASRVVRRASTCLRRTPSSALRSASIPSRRALSERRRIRTLYTDADPKPKAARARGPRVRGASTLRHVIAPLRARGVNSGRRSRPDMRPSRSKRSKPFRSFRPAQEFRELVRPTPRATRWRGRAG